AAVHRFFVGLRQCHPRSHLGSSGRLLARLSAASPPAAKAALQHLVEGALHGANAELFGAPAGYATRTQPNQDGSANVSLLDTNRRFTTAVNFSGGGVWSVFHAGVIGQGLKPPCGSESRQSEELARNSQAFLTLLLRCCRGNDDPTSDSIPVVHPEAAKAVAAALVENICPDAAGGELAWPPEEQARGTVERDLRICRWFR
ncbi:INT5 protein, partial [Geococcyx californianus]|nr:INT5 protein [Geococcyx californianus]